MHARHLRAGLVPCQRKRGIEICDQSHHAHSISPNLIRPLQLYFEFHPDFTYRGIKRFFVPVDSTTGAIPHVREWDRPSSRNCMRMVPSGRRNMKVAPMALRVFLT
jgi:hypothetical protein